VKTLRQMYGNVHLSYEVKVSLCLTKHHAMKLYLLIKHHTMKIYCGIEGIAPCILNLSTRWRWVVSL